MANSDKLRFVASDFIAQTERLLNTTICSGVTLTAINRGTFLAIAHGISKEDLSPKQIPVALGSAKARAFLNVSYRFDVDPDEGYPRVVSSVFAISTGEEKEHALCHFDYERDKADGYPEAHIQVYGTNASLSTLNLASDIGRTLDKLHFPVGGRRFRPTLEDVIEFMIVERLADAREGWREVLIGHRKEYQKIQLRAAIRRDPDTARKALRDIEYAASLEPAPRTSRLGRRRRNSS